MAPKVTTEQPAHAELGASSAYRWMNCPGSVRMSRGVPSRRSIWAAEGTAAHQVGEQCLRGKIKPEQFLGAAISVDDFDEPIEVTDDMVDAVQVYIDHIKELYRQSRAVPRDFSAIEQRVHLSAYADGKDDILHQMFGTADYIRYLTRENTLLVVDYKHGAGVKVNAEGNAQSRYYALGAFALPALKGRRVDRIETHIVQPRANPDEPVSVEVIDPVDLLDWSDELFTAARRTQDPDAPLKAGEWCRFCPVQAVCPEVRKDRTSAAQLVFGESGKIEPKVPKPSQLSLEELKQVLDSASDITAWINAVQKFAHDMLDTGQDVPGYKLVAKRAMRQWKSEKESADWLCEQYGLGDDDLYEKKIKSPAKIEKLLDKDGKKALSAAKLIVAESSGNTLAPVSDKRPAVEGSKQPDKVFSPVE